MSATTAIGTRRIVFVSTMSGDPWAGSEELWSRTARTLAVEGLPVSASVIQSAKPHPRLLDLKAHGVDLWVHPKWHSFKTNPWRWHRQRRHGAAAYDFARLIAARPAALILFSDGGPLPLIELLEMCVDRHLPFVTIGHSNSESFWSTDDIAARFRRVLPAARRCFFVSQGNRRLTEKQVGMTLANAEVVWNPVNLRPDAAPPWPPLGETGELRFACVGRLYPPHKGQDILLEALAGPAWAARPWRLSIYGEGPMRDGLERLSASLGLSHRIVFAGFASVEDIWAANHVLVMPSRYEGLPLTMVEAMLCARAVIATDVAGHAEIVEDGVTGFLAEAATVQSVATALERFWLRRGEAQSIGEAGARRIRQLLPPDPVRIFAEKLKQLAGMAGAGVTG